MENSPKKMVVFDLDGTLVDTKSFVIKALQELAYTFNYDDLSDEDIAKLRNTRSIDFLKVIGLPIWKAPSLIKQIQKMLEKEIASMDLVSGMDALLEKLKQEDFLLGVATSNSKKNMDLFFEKYENKFFDFKWANIFALGKHRALKKIGRKYNVDLKDMYYVGDETRDIRAAQKAGVRVVAVTWGFNTEEILRSMNPDCIAHTPEEISLCLAGKS